MTARFPGEYHKYCEFKDVILPMRDGTRLVGSVKFPLQDGKPDFIKQYPVILIRSAYLHSSSTTAWYGLFEYATANDYVCVEVAARGTAKSEGQLQPLANEGWGDDGRPDNDGWGIHRDGEDTIVWVRKQPWCNGQIVTSGISWQGASQILPWLSGDILGLETSVISNPAINSAFGNVLGYENGFFSLHLNVFWAMMMLDDQLAHHRFSPIIVEKIMEDNALLGNPLGDPRKVNAGEWAKKYGLKNMPIMRHIPFWQKWVENYDNIDFFSYNDITKRSNQFKNPLVFVGGWYDLLLANSIMAYEQAVTNSVSQEVADGHRLVLTPFSHTARTNDYRFANEDTDQASLNIDWFNQQIKGIPADLFQKGKAVIYVMGEERWRAEQAWPLPDTKLTEYYLHSDGNANTSAGDGVLSTAFPVSESADHYSSDPANPVYNIQEHTMFGGMNDHSGNEQRSDVLVYSTPVLEEDVEVTGWINATLYASTSGTDTDFIMKLLDVYPDGSSMHLTTGGVRGRYRNDRKNPEPMVPNQIEKMTLKMRATSNIFKKGHRIRIEVMSTNSSMYDANPNRFIDLRTSTEKDYVIADQTIYHDAEHPSSITLPIIPADKQGEWLDWPYAPEKTGGFDHAAMAGKPACTVPVPMNTADLPIVE
ncbi:CocE/NonD family hydrolase [Paenibacillus amylolyticus]|uniref:CocE/NonD family hydrolase n=1 Tax=Paenibacillus amylolyticus TaxID=1451 RepID=UPI00105A5E8F|nr:CocE/NonD family hydrolase [Paenibacillus amylolyticus]TDL69322.1 CocE/NonD family hydrolase [Paenibacillus amylolyticus]